MELYHQDVEIEIASNHNIYELIMTADLIAKLIKPAQVVFIPQSLPKEIVINEYV